MIGRPVQPNPDEELEFDVAEALHRLGAHGAAAVDRWIVVPPVVTLRMVQRLRIAGLVETVGCPVQVTFTDAGRKILACAIAKAAKGPARGA